MKRALIGPFQLGVMSALSYALETATQVTHQPGLNINSILYASAFQAGVDEFLFPQIEGHPPPRSEFLVSRTKLIPSTESRERWSHVDSAFGAHLPEGWKQDDKYRELWSLNSFLGDLLDAMALGASVLTPWGIPDFAEAQSLLPSELAVPFANLLSAVRDFQAPSPVPQMIVDVDDVQRFNDILLSDVFSTYTVAQSALDDAGAALQTAVPRVASAARSVFSRNRTVLRLRKSSIGILEVTPKLIDATLGKFPGALAEIAAKLGISLLDSRRRIVIYDFQSMLEEIFLRNLRRMFEANRIG